MEAKVWVYYIELSELFQVVQMKYWCYGIALCVAAGEWS